MGTTRLPPADDIIPHVVSLSGGIISQRFRAEGFGKFVPTEDIRSALPQA